MSISHDELDRLLRWRLRDAATVRRVAVALVDSLSVEGLPYDQIPADLYDLVVEFRHLRHDERIAKVRRWLERT